MNKDPHDGKPLKDRNHSKDKILSLSSKLRNKIYDLKTNLHDLGTSLEEKIASTFQNGATDALIAKSDTYEEIKELPPHVEDSDRIAEIASEIEQNIAHSTAEVKQNIDNRAAKIEAEIGDLLGESSESPEIPSLDSLEVLLARSDSYLEGITTEGFNKEELMTAMEAKIKELQNLFDQKNAVYDANEVQKNLDHLQANYEAISKGRGL